jgi:hypothetical protein
METKRISEQVSKFSNRMLPPILFLVVAIVCLLFSFKVDAKLAKLNLDIASFVSAALAVKFFIS